MIARPVAANCSFLGLNAIGSVPVAQGGSTGPMFLRKKLFCVLNFPRKVWIPRSTNSDEPFGQDGGDD